MFVNLGKAMMVQHLLAVSEAQSYPSLGGADVFHARQSKIPDAQ